MVTPAMAQGSNWNVVYFLIVLNIETFGLIFYTCILIHSLWSTRNVPSAGTERIDRIGKCQSGL